MTDPKYMRPGLDHALGKMVEECGELQQILGKVLRFGWDSYNPDDPFQTSNRVLTECEMEDVENAIFNLRKELGTKRYR